MKKIDNKSCLAPNISTSFIYLSFYCKNAISNINKYNKINIFENLRVVTVWLRIQKKNINSKEYIFFTGTIKDYCQYNKKFFFESIHLRGCSYFN